jgi:hypothetical protein
MISVALTALSNFVARFGFASAFCPVLPTRSLLFSLQAMAAIAAKQKMDLTKTFIFTSIDLQQVLKVSHNS